MLPGLLPGLLLGPGGAGAVPAGDRGHPEVQRAGEYALAELQRVCDFCEQGLRDTYQSMRLGKLVSVERQRMSFLQGGEMFSMVVELQTAVPYEGKRADTVKVVVFQRPDGSYMGVSFPRSPFLAA